MKRILLFLLGMGLMVLSVSAHNAKISTLTLRDTGAGWIVEMSFAQASIDAAMLRQFGEEKVLAFEREAYRDEVIAYVRSRFHLTVDGMKIPLEHGGIRLGSHQTDLKFSLPQIPKHLRHINVHIPLFEEEYKHTNIFRIYRGGHQMTKFFLSSDNDFQLVLEVKPEGIETVEVIRAAKLTSWRGLIGSSVTIVVLLIGLWGAWKYRFVHTEETH